jgi:hypothetical protein
MVIAPDNRELLDVEPAILQLLDGILGSGMLREYGNDGILRIAFHRTNHWKLSFYLSRGVAALGCDRCTPVAGYYDQSGGKPPARAQRSRSYQVPEMSVCSILLIPLARLALRRNLKMTVCHRSKSQMHTSTE